MKPEIILINDFTCNTHNLFNEILTYDFDKSMASRWTSSFGKAYNYSGMSYPETPLTPSLSLLASALHKTLGFLPNNCLINLYHSGLSSMGYHSDNTEHLAPQTGVAIISLGSTREISYKNKEDKSIIHTFPLPSGSLLYMDDKVQESWLHSIPKSPESNPRISLTFRKII